MDNYHDQRVYEMRFRRQDPQTEGSRDSQAFDNLRCVAQVILLCEQREQETQRHEQREHERAMRERAMRESAMLRWGRVEDDHQKHGQLEDEGSAEEDLELAWENRTSSTPPTTFSKKKSVACPTSTKSKSSKNSVQEEKRLLLGKLLSIENNIKKRTADFNNWKNEMTKERNELQTRVKKLIHVSKKTKKKLGFENALNIRFRDIKYKEKNRLEKEDEMY